MRILHINCNYIGTTLHQLMIENLNKLNCKNQVFVPTYDKNLSVIKTNSNVCVCECFNKCDRFLFDYKQKKIIKGLTTNIDVSKFDLIHAYTLFTDGNCARNISKKYNIPYVVAIRNTDVNDFFRLRPFLRNRGVKIMKDAAAVFFLSESYKQQVFEKYIPLKFHKEIASKTHIIPNGIDEFWFDNSLTETRELNKENIRLVYAGRVDKNKNIQTTQKAMDILHERGYKLSFTVVGKVQDKKEWNSIIKHQYTKYLSAMPKEKLINIYRESDIFVMPSYTESFGLVYAEAMTQGLPVIYSKKQGFDNQFSEGMVGYHVSPYDANEVADGIVRIINDYDNITKNLFGQVKKFNWCKIVEKYKNIYQSILYCTK